jgi:hypothetical protein
VLVSTGARAVYARAHVRHSGVALGIIFFPIGLLCCFLLREKRCVRCGAYFG